MAVTAAFARHQTTQHGRGGFLLVPVEVVCRADLSDGAFRTYCAVRSYCFGHKTHCWPSIRTLARDRDCSEETIRRHLRELVEAGLITIGKRGRHNVYHFPDRLLDGGEVGERAAPGPRRAAAEEPLGSPRATPTPLRDDAEGDPKPHIPEGQGTRQDENQPTTSSVGDSSIPEEPRDNCSRLLVQRGVLPRVARRLVAQHGEALCRQAVELLDHYQRNGAQIRNPGGWLYSAITQGFLKPRDHAPDAAEIPCADASHRSGPETGGARARPETSPPDPSEGRLEELSRRRRAALSQRGIPQESEDLWQRVVDYLHARGEKAPVLSAAFLRPVGEGRHVVQCPVRALMPRLRELLPWIRAALVEVTGQVGVEVGILE